MRSTKLLLKLAQNKLFNLRKTFYIRIELENEWVGVVNLKKWRLETTLVREDKKKIIILTIHDIGILKQTFSVRHRFR